MQHYTESQQNLTSNLQQETAKRIHNVIQNKINVIKCSTFQESNNSKNSRNKLSTTASPCFFDKIKIKHGPLKLGKVQLTTKCKHGQLS